jgi:hypothetical protein
MAIDTNYNYRLATDDEDFAESEPWWEEEDDRDLIDDTDDYYDDGYDEELGQ